MIRKQYRFYGRVQGVGFRYTVRQAARVLDLTGWVRNEYDGSVTVEVQGDPDCVNRLPEMMDTGRYISIDRWECTGLPVDEEERSFRVEYW